MGVLRLTVDIATPALLLRFEMLSDAAFGALDVPSGEAGDTARVTLEIDASVPRMIDDQAALGAKTPDP